MNERIQELAEQAKKYALDEMIKITDRDEALKIYSDCYDAKFAELIVRKCVFISRTSTDGFSAGRRMEEHFGVES